MTEPLTAPPEAEPETDGAVASPADHSALLVREPVQERSRRTLERLVAAAARLLEDGGPDAVTVTGVAKEARISVGAFYARFSGKEEMVRYLGERWLADAVERWDSVAPELDTELRGGLTVLAALYLDGPARRLALLHGQDDPAPSRLRRFEDRVAGDLSAPGVSSLGDRWESRSESTRFLRALAVVAGIRELGSRAGEGTGWAAGLGPGALAEIVVGLSTAGKVQPDPVPRGFTDLEEGPDPEQVPVSETAPAAEGAPEPAPAPEPALPEEPAPAPEPALHAEPAPTPGDEPPPDPEEVEPGPSPDPEEDAPESDRPRKEEPDVFDVWG